MGITTIINTINITIDSIINSIDIIVDYSISSISDSTIVLLIILLIELVIQLKTSEMMIENICLAMGGYVRLSSDVHIHLVRHSYFCPTNDVDTSRAHINKGSTNIIFGCLMRWTMYQRLHKYYDHRLGNA